MGILDGVLGGIVGAGATALAKQYIEQHGGVQGLVSKFEQSGLGSQVQSWVGNGPNQPITAEQIEKVLGSDTVKNLAQKTGLPLDQIAAKLAEVLPHAVDQMTPSGQVPAAA